MIMKFVHAFWSKPLIQKKFFSIKEALEIILYEYALSIETIHLHHHKIILYTDEIGAKILSILPYDNIIIIENTITDNYHFAASFKFEALLRMSLSDILIDGDIFLHKNSVYNIIKNFNADVLTSFFEDKNYIDNKKERNEKMFEILKPKELTFPYENYSDIDGWFNTSVMKFNSLELKDAYIKLYIDNIKILEADTYDTIWPDLVIELRNLGRLCKQMNKQIGTIIEDFSNSKSDLYAIDIGFLHVGSAKKEHLPIIIKDLTYFNKKLVKKIETHIKFLLKNMFN